ncbi:MAG: YvcK family protein [SAR202 cluster bacterium]|nr:YvcK family protein [SAR202 cluster bacterium]
MSDKKIVVIGGGTGNHTTLSGLKKKDCDITAIVSMSDEGGSSGRLRDDLGQLPPGDIRQCLVALAADDGVSAQLRKLFNYRFTAGEGLNGHSFGNLFLSALTEITGDAASAIIEASRMLRIKGQVLPVTLTKSVLKARLTDGTEIAGESNIDLRKEKLDTPIDYVSLDPKAYPYRPVLEAISNAHAIVIGPGDIYTSILPNLLVEDVAETVRQSKAVKIFVCNLMTKPGESDGFKASDFLRTVSEYLGRAGSIDYCLINNTRLHERLRKRYGSFGQHQVVSDIENCKPYVRHVVEAPLMMEGLYVRHNPDALADAIMSIVDSPALRR